MPARPASCLRPVAERDAASSPFARGSDPDGRPVDNLRPIRETRRGLPAKTSRLSTEEQQARFRQPQNILAMGSAHLPPLQNNMSRAGGALLGLNQWEGEKEGISFDVARRMNAAAQTAGQLADDR